jgi:probable F420-dependent oxidoreductase
MDVLVSLPMQAFIRDLRQGSKQSIRDCVQGLEDLGYWGVIVVDHILRSDTDVAEHHDEQDWNWRFPDPLSTLGYLAAITTTIRLGTRILVVPYRSPIATAHAVATVDSLSGGRVVLGVAPGYDASEFAKLGVPRTRRGRLTDEYLDMMRTLWAADGPVDFDGPTIRFTGAELQVGPVQRPWPPLWVGGNTKVALERAVRVGDGWTPSIYAYHWPSATDGVHLTRDELPAMLAWAAEQRAAAGLAPLTCVPSSGVPLRFTDAPHHAGRTDADIQQFSAVGTAEEQLREFQLFYQAGCTKVVIRLAGADSKDFLAQAEAFAKQIMPYIDQA